MSITSTSGLEAGNGIRNRQVLALSIKSPPSRRRAGRLTWAVEAAAEWCFTSAAAAMEQCNSAEVYRQPDCRLVLGRPRHPMGSLSGDQDMVARTKIVLIFA